MQPENVAILLSTYNWPRALELVLEALFTQTRRPNEIVIADDGSKADTRELIERMKAKAPKEIDIKHVWHEDLGFRKGIILNQGMAVMTSEYIIELDGDCIPERHFVEDHLRVAREGAYVAGSRVMLSSEGSATIQEKGLQKSLLKRFANSANAWRAPFFQNILAPYYKQNNLLANRGCNIGFWRKDILTVNGYDESYTGWGHEDIDLIYRMRNAGLKKRFLKLGGVVYHLYHKEEDRSKDALNKQKALDAIKEKKIRAADGMDKYLRTKEE
ncbi:MAG: glycosyltransferase family 2 protein [Porphyromonas sp.]|nr:glycosyltransferase family 2 protein [Porphyromonas sp.]